LGLASFSKKVWGFAPFYAAIAASSGSVGALAAFGFGFLGS